MIVLIICHHQNILICIEEFDKMGCTPSLLSNEKVSHEQPHKRQTITVQYLVVEKDATQEREGTHTNTLQITTLDGENSEVEDEGIRRHKEKIQFLQENRQFMEQSIEASHYVNQAILALSFNPLLYDQSYHKLMGINKKTLEKKHNRFKNLAKREEKAEMQLKKQQLKNIERAKSQLFKSNFAIKNNRKSPRHSKQNLQSKNYYHTFSKQRFVNKLDQVQLLMGHS